MNIKRKKNGFFMIEALIGVVIFVVGVLGILKLQTISNENALVSSQRAQISILVDSFLSEVIVDSAQTAIYKQNLETQVNSLLAPSYAIVNDDFSGDTFNLSWSRKQPGSQVYTISTKKNVL